MFSLMLAVVVVPKYRMRVCAPVGIVFYELHVNKSRHKRLLRAVG